MLKVQRTRCDLVKKDSSDLLIITELVFRHLFFFTLQISFSPSISNFNYIDYFEVVALGASHCSVVKCCGIGKGKLCLKCVNE